MAEEKESTSVPLSESGRAPLGFTQCVFFQTQHDSAPTNRDWSGINPNGSESLEDWAFKTPVGGADRSGDSTKSPLSSEEEDEERVGCWPLIWSEEEKEDAKEKSPKPSLSSSSALECPNLQEILLHPLEFASHQNERLTPAIRHDEVAGDCVWRHAVVRRRESGGGVFDGTTYAAMRKFVGTLGLGRVC